ncbi:phosphatase [Synergistales bacterium]|nr:phosphatase [Synergistales bacterium]
MLDMCWARPSAPIMRLSFSVRSHVGFARKNNEDNFCCDGTILTPNEREAPFAASGIVNTPCIFAVCDGMGGESDGEFASFATVTALVEHSEKIKSAAALNKNEIDKAVQDFVFSANKILCDAMLVRSVRMGTTLALAVVTDDTIYPYNLGDSRIYARSDGEFRQFSEDHSLAEQKVKMGIITKEQARVDRDRNRLTRHLGIFEDEMTVMAAVLDPMPLDVTGRILLCSDGLTDMVTDARIDEILLASSGADTAAERLLDEALKNGGRDNVTCIVIDIEEKQTNDNMEWYIWPI